MKQTEAFYALLRGVAERRAALLFDVERKLLYPPFGTVWSPGKKDLARCDAFILFFVAELEQYFEWTLEEIYSSYEQTLSVSFLKECRASSAYFEGIRARKAEIVRNNNANWERIGKFFEYVGMNKETHFPTDFWDDIEGIVKHRGHIAHNGAGIRSSDDRRDVIRKIEVTIKRLRHFDAHLQIWLNDIENERARIAGLTLVFLPPLVSIT